MANNKVTTFVKLLCPCCGRSMDAKMVLETDLTKEVKDYVEDVSGKDVGISEAPCDECKSYMDKAIMVIIYNEEKTESMTKPFRTGQLYGLKDEAVKRLFDFDEKFMEMVTKTRMFYLSDAVAKEIGLFDIKPVEFQK